MFLTLLFFFVLNLWVCSGFSGWDHSLEQHLQLYTTRLWLEPFLSDQSDDWFITEQWCFYLWPLMFQDNDQAELVQFLCFFFFDVYVCVRCVILLACFFFKEPSFLVYFVQREVSDGPHLCWWACMFGCEFVYCRFRNNTDQTYFNVMHCCLTYFNPNY